MSLSFSEWSLFWPAFLTGLAFAVFLPVLGCYLRLRDETLAALAYAQVGAAGALGAMAVQLPLSAGGLGAALAAAGIKQGAAQDVPVSQRSTVYALLLVLAWGVGVLLTSNLPLAERLGHALFDGQLLLNGGDDLLWSLLACAAGLGVLFALSRSLLLARLFPDMWRQRHAGWRALNLVFDGLAALMIALATMRLGVMAVFAMLLVSPWLAFGRAASWREARWQAMGLSVFAYALAFVLALYADQPFGPVLALTLMGMAGLLLGLTKAGS